MFFIYLTYSADSRRAEELAVALKEEVEKADWSFKTCGSFEAREVVEDDEEDVEMEFEQAQGDNPGLL